jgi:NAD(P)-dependent dehydrogenase (short-subunit alcohol dehydrogenase family)
MEKRRFEGKVALITGGNSGIGRATAIAFAEEGAKAIIAARREDPGNGVVEEIRGKGGEAIFIKTDVTVPEQVENLFKIITDTYGRLDCAFNNAGVGSPKMKRIVDTTMEEWDHIMNTNIRGLWLCLKFEIKIMGKQGGGAIVNNSSVAGLTAEPGIAIYCASKHAVLGLTKVAALDYVQKNIRINAVCPGFIHTPMLEEPWKTSPKLKDWELESIPVKRFGKPEEIASAVLWMCSDEASFMTGRDLVVGGGQAIHA